MPFVLTGLSGSIPDTGVPQEEVILHVVFPGNDLKVNMTQTSRSKKNRAEKGCRLSLTVGLPDGTPSRVRTSSRVREACPARVPAR